MKKILALVSCLFAFQLASACAENGDDDGNGGGGNTTCVGNGDDGLSCTIDSCLGSIWVHNSTCSAGQSCTSSGCVNGTSTCSGNGDDGMSCTTDSCVGSSWTHTSTCSAGQSCTSSGCVNNGGGGNNPNYLVARTCGSDCIEINGLYCDNSTAQLVGDGAAEGINSWFAGKSLTKQSNGWFRYILTGAAQELHLTLYACGNNPNACTGGSAWADYGCEGSPAAPGTQAGGPFLYCGRYLGGEYTCNLAILRDPGKPPQPRGIVPNGP